MVSPVKPSFARSRCASARQLPAVDLDAYVPAGGAAGPRIVAACRPIGGTPFDSAGFPTELSREPLVEEDPIAPQTACQRIGHTFHALAMLASLILLCH